MKTSPLGFGIIGLLLLWGCSGGGGGGGAPAAAAITAANALDVGGAVLAALAGSEGIGDIGDLAGDLGGTPPTNPANAPPVAEVRASFDNSDVDLCTIGTVRGSLDIADPDALIFEDRLTRGDRFTFIFDACQLDSGDVYTGRLSFTVDRFIGSLSSDFVEYIFDFRLRDLTLQLAGETYEADGDISFFQDTTQSPTLFGALSGGRLDISTAGFAASLRNYDLSTTAMLLAPGLILNSMVSYDGFVSTSVYDGEVQFLTLDPFAVDPASGFPTAGRMRLLGAEGAVLDIEVLPTATPDPVTGPDVQVSLDADGDSLY